MLGTLEQGIVKLKYSIKNYLGYLKDRNAKEHSVGSKIFYTQ